MPHSVNDETICSVTFVNRPPHIVIPNLVFEGSAIRIVENPLCERAIAESVYPHCLTLSGASKIYSVFWRTVATQSNIKHILPLEKITLYIRLTIVIKIKFGPNWLT